MSGSAGLEECHSTCSSSSCTRRRQLSLWLPDFCLRGSWKGSTGRRPNCWMGSFSRCGMMTGMDRFPHCSFSELVLDSTVRLSELCVVWLNLYNMWTVLWCDHDVYVCVCLCFCCKYIYTYVFVSKRISRFCSPSQWGVVQYVNRVVMRCDVMMCLYLLLLLCLFLWEDGYSYYIFMLH